jgi:hypothetical protein
MSGESLPSGVLKVADLLIEARIEGDSRYTLRTSAVAFAKGAEFALNIARRYLASPPPQATGAQPHPSEEASSLPVVCWQHRKRGKSWGLAVVAGFIMEGFERRALTPLADAQSQLNAMRAERDAAREHLARSEGLLAIAIKQNENADRRALKAAQVAPAADGVVEDTERLDWLDSTPAVNVDDMSMREWLWKRPAGVGNIRDAIDAAREALRASLASPEGSPR